jgi:hypothetical protein
LQCGARRKQLSAQTAGHGLDVVIERRFFQTRCGKWRSCRKNFPFFSATVEGDTAVINGNLWLYRPTGY